MRFDFAMNSTTKRFVSRLDDRVNPVVVKDLRQGLRTGSFVFSFLAVQICMSLLFLVSLANALGARSNRVVSMWMWVVLGIMLFVYYPLQAFATLRREKKLNTIELMLMTPLGSHRVVYGKWFALLAQLLVILSGLLPYLILRYYLGGVEIHHDLFALLALFGLSSTVMALAIGFSAFSRAEIFIGLLFLFGMSLPLLSLVALLFGITYPLTRSILISGIIVYLVCCVPVIKGGLALATDRISRETNTYFKGTKRKTIPMPPIPE
jgi:hypothetical protein